jgi:prepilin peptidase CpaA
MSMHSFAWWPTLAVVGVATFTDLRSRRIPNWLVFPFLAAGLIFSTLHNGWHGAWMSLAGMALGLGILGLFFWMGGMGAGDVKLCAAIGAWIWPSQLVIALVVMGIAGGLMALGWAVWGGFLKDLFSGTGSLILGWRRRGGPGEPKLNLSNPLSRRLPYAPAIAIGTVLSFFAR